MSRQIGGRRYTSPLYIYTSTYISTQNFAIHDIGSTYPNATGHDDGTEEDMPLEESGNIIQLALAYVTATSNTAWATKYQAIFTKYASYLELNSLNQASQLSTVDCCGPLKNQTSLAIKAAIGLTAYGKLFNASSYTAAGLALADIFYTQGLALSSDKSHFMLQYGPDVLHGGDASYLVTFNLYPDILLNLSTFPASAFATQASYYPTIRGLAGVPTESRVDWSSTFWTNWAAAAVPENQREVRDMFVNDVWAFMSNGLNDAPFSDRWFSTEGSGGLVGGSEDPIGKYNQWRNRPVQGGLFAVLALEGYDQILK
jgi:hypothetical protein